MIIVLSHLLYVYTFLMKCSHDNANLYYQKVSGLMLKNHRHSYDNKIWKTSYTCQAVFIALFSMSLKESTCIDDKATHFTPKL